MGYPEGDIDGPQREILARLRGYDDEGVDLDIALRWAIIRQAAADIRLYRRHERNGIRSRVATQSWERREWARRAWENWKSAMGFFASPWFDDICSTLEIDGDGIREILGIPTIRRNPGGVSLQLARRLFLGYRGE